MNMATAMAMNMAILTGKCLFAPFGFSNNCCEILVNTISWILLLQRY